MAKQCSIEKCDGIVHARDLCHMHYERWRKYGDPLFTLTESHGMTGTPTYQCWCDMLLRCRNPTSPAYIHYGAKGISVCDRWLYFTNFLHDMGEKPIGLTLDRIDNEGNYEPSNCRWATWSVQARNKHRTDQKLTPSQVRLIRNDRRVLREIAQDYNISISTVHRVQLGMVYKDVR